MMRGTRYSAREGRWYGERQRNKPTPETVRDEREFHTDFGGGMIRVDLGAPIPRGPGEPQPVAVKGQQRAYDGPEPSPQIDRTPLLPTDMKRPHREPRAFKPGLGRD